MVLTNILSIREDVARRFARRRREARLSQAALAEKSGVSLGSLKRFECKFEISFASLLKLAFALGYETDFNALFARPNYRTLDDVLRANAVAAADTRRARGGAAR
jgi:transcriptional regulator with XRE-family HTH domain